MIAILKYNAGNIKSVQNALTRLGCESIITDNPEEITKAKKVIFPGVGEASSAMNYLRERGLDKVLVSLTQPVLGICLGLQLMCRSSEEGNTRCMGIFGTDVKIFPPLEKIPHMGWNNFLTLKGSLFRGLKTADDVYYVHSYYAEICSDTSATCEYILPFSAALQKDNFHATQFHPEKSAAAGEKILKNFLEL
ncbi:MAG TPA: imidazole glycerol phosphate synthase subunit HisH [Bacteroidales bacterium]|nr:imidazole glycerol phosphate synthase subunit HisH [Bacteroidales bacterium]